MRENLSSGVPLTQYSNESAWVQKLARILKFCTGQVWPPYIAAINKGADQTMRMRRLVCDLVVRIRHSQFASVEEHLYLHKNESQHVISNGVVCATSKASNQPAHIRSLI